MELFHKVVIVEKLTLIITLLILAFINSNNAYTAKTPRRFMMDNLVSGLTGAVAFFIIAQMRGSDKGLNIALTTFLLLFMTNVLMEFAGLNDTSHLSQREIAEVTKYKWPALTSIVIGLLVLTVIAYQTNTPLVGSNLLVESVIFGLGSGISAAFVEYDHGAPMKNILSTGGGAAVFFGLLHTALQKGGFYTIVF